MSKFIMPSAVRAKHVAHEIRALLAEHGIPIKLSAAYEVTARAYGFGTWNSLCSSFGSGKPTPDDGLVDADTARGRREQHIRAVMTAGASETLAATVVDAVRPTARGLGKPVAPGPRDVTREVFGPATLVRVRGIPHSVECARTMDGRLTVEMVRIEGKATWRRRAEDLPDGWVTGEIDFRGDDIVFIEYPGQVSLAYPDMGQDLARDEAFLSRMADDAFAYAFHEVLARGRFRHGDHPSRWTSGPREGSEIVCELRGLCEDPVLFYQYLLRHEVADADFPALYAEIGERIGRLGWFELTEAERKVDEREAEAELVLMEARPEGECPTWAMDWTPREPRGVLDRILMAAISGRMTRVENERIKQKLGY